MPKQTPPHPKAVCPRLTVNDLFYYRDVYAALKGDVNLTDIAKQLDVTPKSLRGMLSDVEHALKASEGDYVSVRDAVDAENADRLAPEIFFKRIGPLLDDLAALVHECQKGPRVMIQGSEYSILYLLPHALEQSGFLQKHPDAVLDIRRAHLARSLASLEKRRIDLALGGPAPYGPRIEATHLIRVPRALIYHKNHRFACNKSLHDIDIDDLSEETLFVLSVAPEATLQMQRNLPRPEKPGRRIYLDSVTHMYQYVGRDLGVAIGYESASSPFPQQEGIRTKTLPLLDPANFYLYAPKSDKQQPSTARDDAEALKRAIIETFAKSKAV